MNFKTNPMRRHCLNKFLTVSLTSMNFSIQHRILINTNCGCSWQALSIIIYNAHKLTWQSKAHYGESET